MTAISDKFASLLQNGLNLGQDLESEQNPDAEQCQIPSAETPSQAGGAIPRRDLFAK